MRKGIGSAFTKTALAAVAALLSLAVFSYTTGAQGPLNFGIRPANTSEDDAVRGAYFTYTLEPGATIDDEAIVVNNGEETLTLKLYAADGVTAISGGTAFAAADEVRTGVRSWLSADVSDLEMAPGETVAVPFTLQIPPDARPGDHVAGWVVEGQPKVGGGDGVGAAVIERVGVAVVVRVPGPTQELLSLGAMCLNQETGSNYFQMPVVNDGDVFTKASGALSLATEDGDEVFNLSVELGTVLPGDDTFLRVDAPMDPGPGSYVAELSLRQTNGQEIQVSTEIEIGEEKVNGCQALSPDDKPPEEAQGLLSIPSGGDIPWLIIILVALVVFFAAVLAGREFVWRRRR
ncbi:MAG: DUF916 domain-containing protein [Dehalococcoidia bacterium]